MSMDPPAKLMFATSLALLCATIGIQCGRYYSISCASPPSTFEKPTRTSPEWRESPRQPITSTLSHVVRVGTDE